MVCVLQGNPIRFVDPWGLKPGDKFASADDAAIDFGLCYNEASINDDSIIAEEDDGTVYRSAYGLEYASAIYIIEENEQIYYTYNEPNKGDLAKSVIPVPTNGEKIVGYVHTHAGYNPSGDPDNFSEQDLFVADINKWDAYVVTPSGELKKCEVSSRNETILSRWMPYDSNHHIVKSWSDDEKKTHDMGILFEQLKNDFKKINIIKKLEVLE